MLERATGARLPSALLSLQAIQKRYVVTLGREICSQQLKACVKHVTSLWKE